MYDVTVEENGAGAPAAVPVAAPGQQHRAAAPAAAPKAAAGAGSIQVKAGAAGKVFRFTICWTEGEGWRYSYYHWSNEDGDTVVAPEAGTIAGIDVK